MKESESTQIDVSAREPKLDIQQIEDIPTVDYERFQEGIKNGCLLSIAGALSMGLCCYLTYLIYNNTR